MKSCWVSSPDARRHLVTALPVGAAALPVRQTQDIKIADPGKGADCRVPRPWSERAIKAGRSFRVLFAIAFGLLVQSQIFLGAADYACFGGEPDQDSG